MVLALGALMLLLSSKDTCHEIGQLKIILLIEKNIATVACIEAQINNFCFIWASNVDLMVKFKY